MEKIDFVVPLTMSHRRHKTSGTSANPSLSYHAVPFPDLVQKRFKDRVMFTPGIDLKQYKCRAVVDWIRLECRTSTTTQSVAVSHWFEEATGVRPHVTSLSKNHDTKSRSNYTGTDFAVKVQNPGPQMLSEGFDAINRERGLECDPRIIGIEISLDWFPDDGSDDLRLQMTAALIRHHLPEATVTAALQSRRDDLRYTHQRLSDPNNKDTRFVLPDRKRHPCAFSDQDVEEDCVRQRIFRDRPEQQIHLDSTVYRGKRGSPVMFRYQNKVSDRRRPEEDNSVELRPEERRSRIEVTLLGDGVSKFGFTTLSDLRGFQFQKLKRELFSMYLPTFGGTLADLNGTRTWQASTVKDVVNQGRRRLHIDAFREGGIYGLDRFLDASRHETKRMLKRAKAGGPELAISKRPRNRIGTGDTGSKVAWQEINKRHSNALTNLSRYWK